MYEFSMGSFFIGALILIAAGILTLFHQKFADNLGSGINSYDRFKLVGLLGCILGFVVMTSLHSIPLNMLADAIFR